jgi:hypothetical protein
MLISSGSHPKKGVQYWKQSRGISGPQMCAIEHISKLGALILILRVKLVRFYDAFSPISKQLAQTTTSKQGRNTPKLTSIEGNQLDKPCQTMA